MRNPVAKHLNTFNKPSIIAHKKRSKQMDAEMLEAEDDAHTGLYEGFDTDEDKCLNDVGCSSISIDREE